MARSGFKTAFVLAFAWWGTARAQTRDVRGEPACALLSSAEIKAVTGEDLLQSSRPSYIEAFQVKTLICNHRTENWYIRVAVDRFPTADGPKTFFQQLKDVVKQTTNSDAKPVSGLGGEAWWGPAGPDDGILYVARGNDVLRVQSWGKAAAASTLQNITILMQKVLANYAKFPKS